MKYWISFSQVLQSNNTMVMLTYIKNVHASIVEPTV